MKGAEFRPYCVTCRRPMYVGGSTVEGRHQWRCHGCGRATMNFFPPPRRSLRPPDDGARPFCPACRLRMLCNGRSVKTKIPRFICPGCRESAARYRSRSRPFVTHPEVTREKKGRSAGDRGVYLLAFVFEVIPANLPAEVREEAAQALALDLLKKRRRRSTLTPKVVRKYVRDAYGFSNSKRFISLEAPTRGGSPFGAMLEG